MKQASILIIDDEPAIRTSLSTELRGRGYQTSEAENGEEGVAALRRSHPDLILMDLAMPVLDGFAAIAEIRKSDRVPIVVLSVRGAEQDRVRALDLGADDFVAKPFSVEELLARIRAQLRRSGLTPPPRLAFPGLIIDFEKRRVIEDDREIKLTPTEFALLSLLATNAGRVVTTDQILARIWKETPTTTADTVRVHIASLRRKIEPDPASPRFLVTEPWVGYRFIAEPVEE